MSHYIANMACVCTFNGLNVHTQAIELRKSERQTIGPHSAEHDCVFSAFSNADLDAVGSCLRQNSMRCVQGLHHTIVDGACSTWSSSSSAGPPSREKLGNHPTETPQPRLPRRVSAILTFSRQTNFGRSTYWRLTEYSVSTAGRCAAPARLH